MAAEGFEETADSVRSVKDRVTRRVRHAALIEVANDELVNNIVFRDRDRSIDDRKTDIAARWLGSTYTSTPKVRLEGPYRRVIVVSDYHGTVHPFIEQWLLNNTYDICIHAGDILDSWSLHKSRLEGKSLTQQERATTIDEEIQTMRAWFEILDEKTEAEHIVLMGNHDARLYAQFVRLLDPILRSESLLSRMFITPLELLTQGLHQFKLGSRPMQWTYPDNSSELAATSQYLYEVGDALVSHMNFTGSQPGTAVNKLWQWIQTYRLPLQLSHIRLALQAHTHSLMLDKNCQGGSVHLVETGCAMRSTAAGYGLVYNGNWTPAAVGLVSFDQFLEDSQWVTRLNSVKLQGVTA
jgi:hypothetical protein